MTFMPVHTVPRLYGDHTLAVIQELVGGRPLDQASDAIASQTLDPEVWRSMNKGPLEMVGRPDADKYRAFARALAYDDTLPFVVMPRVQKLRRASRECGRCEVVYFPDAIGLLHLGDVTHRETGLRRMVKSTMCLITRDIRPDDFVRRHAPFERTMWRWLDHLRSASIRCEGLKLPRADHLLRAA